MPIHLCDPVRVRVPAKVNLHLSIGPLRADGYHELVTVFHAVDLVDEIDATPADALSITVTGEGAGTLPTDEHNIVWRAATLLADAAGIEPRAHLAVRKAIPVAGGMAGGSADAAATLLACARLWRLELTAADLLPLAARLGSDVVFPLVGGTATGTGRGEILAPLEASPTLHWVFAIADIGVSTVECYRELDRQRDAGTAPAPIGPPDALRTALHAGDVDAIAACLGNDMQPATLALAPSVAATLEAGRDALAGIVSGSGPTCAFLCAHEQAATVLAAELESAGVCRTARVARGPVPGATVVA